MEYQTNYTENPVAQRNMYDEAGRQAKADKILAILADYLGDTRSLDLLDVSCSTGIISRRFATRFRHVTGIDIDEGAVEFARSLAQSNLQFEVMDALATDFSHDTFDVVVCNQMYEHVPDADKLMREIHRILRPGGVCYFGATNRLKVIETHYGRLPFLSWLPKPAANLYLKILGRGDYYYEKLYTYWTLKRLCADFEIVDYTLEVVSDPVRFDASEMVDEGSLQQRTALTFLKYAYWLSPGYIWLLKKPGTIDHPATPKRPQ